MSNIPHPNPQLIDRTLLNTQKKAVFDLIKAAGLDPRQFKMESVQSSQHQRPDVIVSKLVHEQSGFFCLFNSTRDGSLSLTRSPGRYIREETLGLTEWADQWSAAKEWVLTLKEELEQPDPWEEIGGEALLTKDALLYTTDNRPLTAAEQTHVAENIEDLKQLLREKAQLDDDHFAFLVTELNGLKESARTFGKKDFLNLVLATVINISVSLGTQPDVRREIFNIGISAFHWLVQNPPQFFPVTGMS